MVRQPYKLIPTGEQMTRDDVQNWQFCMLAFMRQEIKWSTFLPGGTNNTWTSTDDNQTNGLVVKKTERGQEHEIDQVKTTDLQNSFKDFMTCLATNFPVGFLNTVRREATSIKWVIDKIYRTYNLETRGQHFLDGLDLKFELLKSGPALAPAKPDVALTSLFSLFIDSGHSSNKI